MSNRRIKIKEKDYHYIINYIQAEYMIQDLDFIESHTTRIKNIKYELNKKIRIIIDKYFKCSKKLFEEKLYQLKCNIKDSHKIFNIVI